MRAKHITPDHVAAQGETSVQRFARVRTAARRHRLRLGGSLELVAALSLVNVALVAAGLALRLGVRI